MAAYEDQYIIAGDFQKMDELNFGNNSFPLPPGFDIYSVVAMYNTIPLHARSYCHCGIL